MTTMDTPIVKTGGVDIWTDLLIACLVVLVVLAPAFLFRVPTYPDAATSVAPAKKSSIYYHNENDARSKRRRQVKVQQQPSGRSSDLTSKHIHSNSNGAPAARAKVT
ncbi:hypothetical protein L917_20891 [Phytophthora nicotianae]|uniref:Uncharacterized protein n=3 Tax=Phytophthora nicotianae TaxID=4792 RepID=W2QTP1_PHYN3|nr:hypothetical protein PPTG_06471 [Phytophthora nicotianae INRA-310]ETL25065.1 hypothetical protein L916_21034 [Phytophthora nicotianae]ETL78284.1 hypothetical protein L917_20891 [Phytophthora nicotianae]ETN16306.1 hypothetical protein PPTG_06471 [Phytophthora nicotianae INRA-310]ETO59949.1 hypothetical protein F444_21787 [Phytophthora nicotianae P1976]